MSDDITAVLIGLIQPLVEDENASVGPDTAIVDELGLSSLQVMELIEQVEDHYDVSYPLNDLADVTTVRDLSEGVGHLLQGDA